MSERVMASIEQIKAVLPHTNADRLSIYKVKGWQAIDQKDAYKVGDLVIYCEVDSWIPTELAPFLTKGKEPREFNGVKGERLRTIKLRGQLSQGLLLPVSKLYDLVEKQFKVEMISKVSSDSIKLTLAKDRLSIKYPKNLHNDVVLLSLLAKGYEYLLSTDLTSHKTLRGKLHNSICPLYTDSRQYTITLDINNDVSPTLNIQKWEKPIPAQLAGQVRGSFPEFLRKTDQERIQNIPQEVLEEFYSQQTIFQITEKLDGSSMTVYNYNEEWGVTSRNIDLKLDQEGNTFVDMFRILSPKLDTLKEELVNLGIPNFAVQGELIGGNIQGNQYKINGFDYYIFDIYNIDTQEYLHTSTVETLARISGINHVPVIANNTLVTTSITDLLLLAEDTSRLNNSEREGLVYKTLDRKFSFKTISNSWLLSND